MALERELVSADDLAVTSVIAGHNNGPLGNCYDLLPLVYFGHLHQIKLEADNARQVRSSARVKYRQIKRHLKNLGFTVNGIENDGEGIRHIPGDLKMNMNSDGIVMDRFHYTQRLGLWYQDRLVVTKRGVGLFQRKTYIKRPYEGDSPISFHTSSIEQNRIAINPAYFIWGLNRVEEELGSVVNFYKSQTYQQD